MKVKIGSKGYEQIPVNFVILLAIFAMGAAVFLLMIGKWLDVTGIKYKFETQRNAMSLSHLIVANSPIVKRDSNNEPLKLILDGEKLDEYENTADIGKETLVPGSNRDIWERCCDFMNFDYNLTVHDIVTGENWTMGNLIFDQLSDCYHKRVRGFSDLPVVIENDGRKDAGVAIVDMSSTPVSDLSYWLSQSFLRASWNEYWSVYSGESEYIVKVPLDGEIGCIKFIDTNPADTHADCINNYGRVCVILNDGRESCKNYVCDSSIVFNQNGAHSFMGDCFDVIITSERGSPNSVNIFYPGDCSEYE